MDGRCDDVNDDDDGDDDDDDHIRQTEMFLAFMKIWN